MNKEKNHQENLNLLNCEIVQCRKCSRLVTWREEVARTRRKAYRDQEYWGKPVPGFGDINGKVLVVGLAPGAHGSNRTGRMFTGDRSGEFLYRALYKHGYANQESAVNCDDGLVLQDIFISAVCRCVPPQNKPTKEEINQCLPYLEAEMRIMPSLKVVVALGKIAYDTMVRILKNEGKGTNFKSFSHGVVFNAGENQLNLVGSYHPSQQNTQTGRLTFEAFSWIWQIIRDLENTG